MKPLVDVIIIGSKPIKGMKSIGSVSSIKVSKNKSILDYQIKNISKKINVNNIFYVGGHGFESLTENNNNKISWIYNNQHYKKNNGYSLKLALQKSKSDNILILFNKIIFSHEIFNFFDFNKSQIFISDHSKYGVGSIYNQNNQIINLFYNLNNRCCGIYYITKKEIEYIKKIIDTDNTFDNLFIFEIINKVIDSGGVYYAAKIIKKRMFYIIQNNKTLQAFKKYYAKYFDS